MQLTGIVSVQHTSQVGFVDEAHLCYAVPFGLVIEHAATGRQVHQQLSQLLVEQDGVWFITFRTDIAEALLVRPLPQ